MLTRRHMQFVAYAYNTHMRYAYTRTFIAISASGGWCCLQIDLNSKLVHYCRAFVERHAYTCACAQSLFVDWWGVDITWAEEKIDYCLYTERRVTYMQHSYMQYPSTYDDTNQRTAPCVAPQQQTWGFVLPIRGVLFVPCDPMGCVLPVECCTSWQRAGQGRGGGGGSQRRVGCGVWRLL